VTGVPIAVPDSCCQNVLAKLKMLFFITTSRMLRNMLTGKFLGILSELLSRKSLIVDMPRLVSMLVYIDFASAENSRAFSGISMPFCSFMMVVEFLM